MAVVNSNRCVIYLIAIFFTTSYGMHFSYTSRRNNETCILIDTNFFIKVDAIRDERVLASVNLSSAIPDEITVTGLCGTTASNINIAFPDGIQWSLFFNIDENSSIVTLDRMIQFVPNNIFDPKITDIGKPITFDDEGTSDLSRANYSYLCNNETKQTYLQKKPVPGNVTFSVTNTVSMFHVQAFGVKNGTYNPSMECGRDTSATTTPSHSTMPTAKTVATSATTITGDPTTETTIPNPGSAFYVEENSTVCMALTAKILLNIRYIKKDSNGIEEMTTKTFHLPANSKATGDCELSRDYQSMIISFFEEWNLRFIFKRKEDQSNVLENPDAHKHHRQDKLDYRIHTVNLTYAIDYNQFPGSILPEGEIIYVGLSDSNSLPHKSKGAGYYSCEAVVPLSLSDNVTLDISHLKFKAFNRNDDRGFEGDPSTCSASHSSNNIAAIVAGSVAGLCLVIVVVVVVCVCRRKRQGMEGL